VVPPQVALGPNRAQPGDLILVSGTLGDHGVAIMSVREGLEFETVIQSDCAPLADLVAAMLTVAPDLHVLRDPTRGGLASSLNEIAGASHVGMVIEERAVPVRPDVAAACEMLGLDPLYVANEGKLVAILPAAAADATLAVLHAHPLGHNAAVIGRVVADHPGQVVARTPLGATRLIDLQIGEQLPRIC
jgi:hydrogenase expression/formation protein HypE